MLEKSLPRLLLFLAILELAFVIHEYGHLQEFQKRNVPIREFSLGIGPALYQYDTGSYTISVRAFPIKAYVAPTEEGDRIFRSTASFLDKMTVDLAGIRNNLLVGLIGLWLFQILGYWGKRISAKKCVTEFILSPLKLVMRFVAFVLGCVTFGAINISEKFVLSTGNVHLRPSIRSIIRFNLMLGIFNLLPLPLLDGGRFAEESLQAAGYDFNLADYPWYAVAIFLVVM